MGKRIAGHPPAVWLRLLALAFVLHLGWEMAQMDAYREMADRPWPDTLGRCGRAAVFDAFVTLAVAGPFMGRLGRRWSWFAIAACGLVAGAAIEAVGLRLGRWAYAEAMPTWPLVRLGVLPTLQMAALPVVSAWLAAGHGRARTVRTADRTQ